MSFNFHDQFKGYSNIDLLKIIYQPDNYQAEAVNAAKQIIQGRDVPREDHETAERIIAELKTKILQRQQKEDQIKDKVYGILEPVLAPGTELRPDKWLTIFLVVVTAQYGWTLYQTGLSLFDYFTCASCDFDFALVFEIISLIYIPIILLLLYRRKRLGWILLFADSLFSIIIQLSQSYIFFEYQSIHHGSTIAFLWPIVINGFFIFFLLRNSVSEYFNVTPVVKKKTALITVAIALSFVAIVNLIY